MKKTLIEKLLRPWHQFVGNREVYLDYAASTPLDPRVHKTMEPYWADCFGNPSSIHHTGLAAARALKDARRRVARVLKAREEEVVFTSSGTESNNMAIWGVIEARQNEGTPYERMHIVTSALEHVSVLKPVAALKARGVAVSYVDVDEKGRITEDAVQQALRPETVLVSLMYVNNEIGTITSVRKIAGTVRKYFKEKDLPAPLIHSDASQAPLFLDCSPERLQVDLLTIDAQKIYGPKGIGMLYKKHDAHLVPFMIGGEQEWSLRAGTEALPLIVGFSYALLYAAQEREKLSKRLTTLRDDFVEDLQRSIPSIEINGDRKDRIPNNVNISIPDEDMEFLVVKLDTEGIRASTASACLSQGGVSHVLRELRLNEEQKNALRFTFGRDTTRRDLQRALSALKKRLHF